MVASMGVGGVGRDLSCSDYAIFVELDWTPANVQQAEMRTFHKDRPHVVVVLYTDDPVESRLIEALDIKNGFAGALGLGSNEIMRKVLI
jgi:SNF2 family DNA or RNA helicase